MPLLIIPAIFLLGSFVGAQVDDKLEPPADAPSGKLLSTGNLIKGSLAVATVAGAVVLARKAFKK